MLLSSFSRFLPHFSFPEISLPHPFLSLPCVSVPSLKHFPLLFNYFPSFFSFFLLAASFTFIPSSLFSAACVLSSLSSGSFFPPPSFLSYTSPPQSPTFPVSLLLPQLTRLSHSFSLPLSPMLSLTLPPLSPPFSVVARSSCCADLPTISLLSFPKSLHLSVSLLRSSGLCYDSSHQRRVARSQTINPSLVVLSKR